jgi:hopanoid biosynthesis associated protein HpnK
VKRLIVNADDFGLTPGVNQAIISGHSCGLISSTSLLANGAAFESALSLAAQAPRLGVGVHLNLTEGSPVAPVSGLRSLVNSQGRFARKPGALWRALAAGRVSAGEVETEWRAQIEKVQAAGIAPTHLDSHKHVHAWPTLGRMSIRLAREHGVGCVRQVAESWPALGLLLARFPGARASVLRQYLNGRILALLSLGWSSQLGRAGAASSEHFFGVTPTGFLDSEVVREILRRLPEGTSELMCHPGYVDQALKQTPTRLIEQREMEYQALTQPGIKRWAEEMGIQLINYGDLKDRSILR